jgi:hypothetical protein
MVDCLRIRAKVPAEAKEALTPARFTKALDAVRKGDFTADALRAKYALTDAQLASLAEAETAVTAEGGA